MDAEPTVIIKSLKDLDQFLYMNKDAQKQDITQPSSSLMNVSRIKLSFSDSVCSIDSVDGSSINLRLADSVAFNYDEDSMVEPSFAEKHQNVIAGFDVCKRLRDKNKEIIEGKARISLLQSKAGNVQSLNKKMSFQYENEIELLRKKSIEDKELTDELKRQIKELKDGENGLKEEITQMKKSSDEKIFCVEKRYHGSQEDHMKEVHGLLEERDDLRKTVAKMQAESEESKLKISLQEEQKTDMEEQLRSMSTNLRSSETLKYDMENMKLQLSRSELNSKELNIRLEALQSTESKQQLLDKSLIRLSSLEKEMSRLKEENDTFRISALNIALVEEKLSSSEKEVEVLQSRCKNLTEENATLITLRNLSEQSECIIREQLKLDYSPSPPELKSILADLCSCDSELRNSVAELKTSVKSHESFRESQEALLGKLKSQLEEKQDRLSKDGQLIRRLQRKLLMVSKERDSLKEIIGSYESESTLNISALEKQRIASLETQLNAYKQELANLESEFGVSGAANGSSSLKERDTKCLGKIVELEKKVVELEELVEILNEEKQALEVRIETQLPQGTFNPTTTKVVQLVNNPLAKANSERKQLMEKLQKENDSLKCRLKLIDEGEHLDLTQKVGANVDSNKQIKELEEMVDSSEKRNQRLMEVFKKKSYDFREVVYRLTGYRVDVGTDSKYKLINMYSDSQDFLLFEQTQNGELQMLQTDFSCNLRELMEEYLENMSSFPGFLSAVTLNLIAKSAIDENASDDQLSECEELPSEGDEHHSDEQLSDCDDQLSDVEDHPSDDPQSDIDDPPSDDQQSDMEDPPSDEQLSEEEEEPSDSECEDDPPAKRMKIDEDDDDDLICLD